MYRGGRNITAPRSGVQSIEALVGSVLFDVLFLKSVKLGVLGFFEDLHSELCPLASSPKTIKLPNQLCTAGIRSFMPLPSSGERRGGNTYVMFIPGGYVIDITVTGLWNVLKCIRMGHLF